MNQSLREDSRADKQGSISNSGGRRGAWVPIPCPGGNPVLDLIACHGLGLHTVIHIWDYTAPAASDLLVVAVGLAAWRVWFQAWYEASEPGHTVAMPNSSNDPAPEKPLGQSADQEYVCQQWTTTVN